MNKEIINSYSEYPSESQMIEDLSQRNIGHSESKRNWNRTKNDIQKFWLAMKLSNNLGDIKYIKSIPECDLLTFTFPCTDISVQGKEKGFNIEDWKNGHCTRSGLVWEVLRLLYKSKEENTLPKYMLLENVSNITAPKHIKNFNYLNNLIAEIGYNYYYKIINSKDCGVPQNRKRMFVVYIKKDIDKETFNFPVPFLCKLKAKDILEPYPDEKYYYSSLTTNQKNNKVLYKSTAKAEVLIRSILDKYGDIIDYEVCDKSIKNPKIKETANCILRQYNNGIANIQSSGTAVISKENDWYRIRDLTPCECFKLMGMSEDDFLRTVDVGISDCQAYKQAGNGIVTDCVKLIIQHLYKAQYDSTFLCDDESYSDKK